MGNWSKRRRAEIVERGAALAKWADRMINIKQRKEKKDDQ
jgi:hypothetical protein